MKLGIALFLTLISLMISGQCHPLCNVIQNGSFTSSWSNWTKQTGWGISTYAGNSTTAMNTVDNSPAAGYSIQQSVSNVSGTKVWRLTFDAYAQNPNPGTSFLDFFLDNTRFVRLVNASGASGVTSTLYNGAVSVSTSNWSFSTWKRGYSIDIPWISSDTSVTLKVTFISNSSQRDWGVDNIELCRYSTLPLTDVKWSIQQDSLKMFFLKNANDVVHVYTFDALTGKSEHVITTAEMQVSVLHTSKYYRIVSDGFNRVIGPFPLIADDPRKYILSTKQLLGQYTN